MQQNKLVVAQILLVWFPSFPYVPTYLMCVPFSVYSFYYYSKAKLSKNLKHNWSFCHMIHVIHTRPNSRKILIAYYTFQDELSALYSDDAIAKWRNKNSLQLNTRDSDCHIVAINCPWKCQSEQEATSYWKQALFFAGCCLYHVGILFQ